MQGEGKDRGIPPNGALAVAREGSHLALASDDGHRLSVHSRDSADDNDEINLVDYWRIIVKRRWTILAVLALVFVVALVGTLLQPSIYRATVMLQIDRDTMQVVKVEGMVPTESSQDRDFYQTQYELLKSRRLAQRVIDELRLADDPVFTAMNTPSPLASLISRLKPGSADSDKPVSDSTASSGLINAFLSNLSVQPVRNSRLVSISYDSLDPTFSAKVANALGQGFIALNLDRRVDSSSYAKTFLEDKLAELRVKLEDSEKKLVTFAQKEQIVNIDDKQSLVSRQLSELNEGLSEAEKARVEAEGNYRQAQIGSGDAIADVLKSSLISKLREKEAELQGEYQDKLGVLQPGFPTMIRLQSQISEINKKIAGEVNRIRSSVKSTYDGALAKETMLAARVKDLKTQVLDLDSRSIEYNVLKRDTDTNRELYDGLLQRYKEIGVAGGVGTNNISVVDAAEPPTGRAGPRLGLNLAVAILLGLFGGVLLAFVFEHLDDTVKTPEDIERHFGVPLLGIVPKLKKGGTPGKEMENPQSAFAEAYRSVRTALQFATDKGVPRTLFVTSSTPGEGKSTTALALANHFAQLGKRVLLIDADLRNPSLHRALGLKNASGLTNYLAGDTRPLSELNATSTPLLTCLTSGPLPPNPAELLAGPKMLSLLSLVSQTFDQVIIDGPPVLGLADAAILGNLCAGTLLVVESGGARLGYARGMLRRLQGARSRVIGAILTKYDHKVAGYGYGYGYGYGAHADYAYGPAPKQLKRA